MCVDSKKGIPDDWKQVSLGDVCHKIGSGITPKGGDKAYVSDGVPFLRSQNIHTGRFVTEGLAYITREQHKKMIATQLQPNDVLLNITGASIGRCTLFPEELAEGNVNQHVCIIRTKKEQLQSRYLSEFLNSTFGQNQIFAFQAGGNREGLNFQQIRSFFVPLPPLPEQQKIAEILTSVDETIESTRKVIAQTKKVKQGLLQELLTKGIGHTKFKDTEIGRIPAEWEISPIDDHVDLLCGFAFKSSGYTDLQDAVKLLRGDNIGQGVLRWRDAKFWRSNDADNFDIYHLESGDFVIAMDRTWVSSGLKIAEVRDVDLPCLLVQRVARLRAEKTITQSLLRQIFSSYRFENYVKSVQTETAVPHISAKQIKDYIISVPPLGEQNKIASILTSIDNKITAQEKELEALQQMKKGLMQDLLTGKVRVKV